MNLSKELKKKRDAEDRLRGSSPQPFFIGEMGYIDLSELAPKNHTHTFLNLTDTPNSYIANKFIKVNAAGDALELGDGGGGGAIDMEAYIYLHVRNGRWI